MKILFYDMGSYTAQDMIMNLFNYDKHHQTYLNITIILVKAVKKYWKTANIY